MHIGKQDSCARMRGACWLPVIVLAAGSAGALEAASAQAIYKFNPYPVSGVCPLPRLGRSFQLIFHPFRMPVMRMRALSHSSYPSQPKAITPGGIHSVTGRPPRSTRPRHLRRVVGEYTGILAGAQIQPEIVRLAGREFGLDGPARFQGLRPLRQFSGDAATRDQPEPHRLPGDVPYPDAWLVRGAKTAFPRPRRRSPAPAYSAQCSRPKPCL